VAASQIYQWKKKWEQYGDEAFQGNGVSYTQEAKVAELERKIGQLTMENDLLKKANNILQDLSRREKLRGKL
jgi:transposase